MKKWPILLVLSLMLASCHKKQIAPPAPPQVTVVSPLVQDTTLYNRYVGQIQPFVSIQIRSQVEGQLTGSYFIEGQMVNEGDLLFTIDSRPYEAQLASAQAQLAQNKANFRIAQETAQRYSKLAQKEFVSKLTYDQYLTNVLVTEAGIAESEANIDIAKINIDYCHIRAGVTGIIGLQTIDQGNLIQNAGEQALAVLNQITPIYVYFYIPQGDLPSIQTLQASKPLPVQIFLNQDYTHPFVGELNLINNQVDLQTGTTLLRGQFPNEDKKLWPGEFVDVRLITGVQKDAILVPNQAVAVGQKGHYVFVIKEDMTAELRWIEVGQRFDDYIIVTKGAAADDKVVIEGQINLSPGKKVVIKQGSGT